jgi:hypothetical protein
MKNIKSTLFIILCVMSKGLFAQKIKLEANNLEANKVYLSFEKLNGNKVIKVIKDSTVLPVGEPTFVSLHGGKAFLMKNTEGISYLWKL